MKNLDDTKTVKVSRMKENNGRMESDSSSTEDATENRADEKDTTTSGVIFTTKEI